ncbi:phosphoenolpyruvate-utilizing N-terminal domain-containing protein [Escherichia coli]
MLEEYIQVRFIDSDSVQPTQAELTAHPLPRSLSRLNPDLLYGNVLASGVGVGTLTLLQSDSLDSYRAIPASAQDSTRLEHSLATLAEQLNQQLRERDGESKTILSAHLSLIQDDEFAGNIRRLMTEQHQGWGRRSSAIWSRFAPNFLPLPAIICANVLATFAISANSCCISPGRN